MTTTFRTAQKEDAPALVRLHDIATEGMASVAWQRMGLADGRTGDAVAFAEVSSDTSMVSYRNTILAMIDGEAVAMINYTRLGRGSRSDLRKVEAEARPYATLMRLAGEAIYVVNVAVLPEYRGQGLARALMNIVVDGAARSGGLKLAAAVFETNSASLGLFKGLGFRPTASRAVLKHVTVARGTRILLLERAGAQQAAA